MSKEIAKNKIRIQHTFFVKQFPKAPTRTTERHINIRTMQRRITK